MAVYETIIRTFTNIRGLNRIPRFFWGWSHVRKQWIPGRFFFASGLGTRLIATYEANIPSYTDTEAGSYSSFPGHVGVASFPGAEGAERERLVHSLRMTVFLRIRTYTGDV